MKKVHSKSRRNTPAKRPGLSGTLSKVALPSRRRAQQPTPVEIPGPAMRLATRARRQEEIGQRNGYHRLYHDVLATRRLVFTRRFVTQVHRVVGVLGSEPAKLDYKMIGVASDAEHLASIQGGAP